MAQKSPFILVKGVDSIGKDISKALGQTRIDLKDGVDKVVDIVYRTARAKRPMVTMYEFGGEQMSIPGKIPKSVVGMFKKVRRVSDPAAKFGVPVRTGALQKSIKKASWFSGPATVKGKVWTDLFYAGFIEYGTSKMAMRPFMRPAYDLNKVLIQKYLGTYKETGVSMEDAPDPNESAQGASSGTDD